MARVTILFSLLLAAAAIHASDVVTLTTSNFKEIVDSSSFALVEFYAPWCGHCKKLAPIWEQAATLLKDKGIVVAQVDATVETDLASEYGIQGFPTIKYFTKGQLSGVYEGGREVEDIVAFAKAYSGPAISNVNEEELKQLRAANSLVIAVYDEALLEIATEVANALRTEATFALVSANAEGKPPVVAYKSYDEGEAPANIDDYASAEALKKFVQTEAVKLFDEMGPQNYRKYLSRGLPIGWLFVKPSENGPERDEVAKIAGAFKGRLSFIWVDADKYAGISERLGLDGKRFPAFAIDVEQSSHYTFPEAEPFTGEAISQFAEKVLAGSIDKTVRSEPEPNPETKDGLTTVVGSTFDKVVFNSNKNVMIEFYAPWCGHCKNLAPTYAAVAKAFANKENVIVAKIDATANDFDAKTFPVRGFPALFFLPAGSRTPEEYSGDRSEVAIWEFIEIRLGGKQSSDEEDEL